MAIGIAGDSPQTIPTATLTTAQTLDLLTQLLIEMRTQTVIQQAGLLPTTDDLNNIRNDQDIEIVTGTGFGQG